jgi:carboxylesterase type B
VYTNHLLQETGDYYLFTSIPYAEQPVGALRFQKPVAISGSSSNVNNGSTNGTMCIQAYPQWVIDLEAEAYGIDSTTMAEQLYAGSGQTESCLLLDVYVPTAIFNQNTGTKG